MAGAVTGTSASGIDTQKVLDSIIKAKSRPIDALNDRISKAKDQKSAFLDINSRLLSIQETAKRLSSGASFNASVIKSSKPDVLLATGDTSSLEGTFQFYTKSLSSVAQYVSSGFADSGATRVTKVPGTMTIEVGDASVLRQSEVDRLNGGNGMDRGKLRITDDMGRTAIIDLSFAVTMDDVVDAINNNGIAQVSAKINDQAGTGLLGDGLMIQNLSGAGNIAVSNVGLGKTATSLGIEATGASGLIIGSRINTVGRSTQLSWLNDGRGIGDGSTPTWQIQISGSGGPTNVTLTGARTVGEVIDLINQAGGTVTASLSATGKGLTLTDSVPGTAVTVNDMTGAGVVRDLGLEIPMLGGAATQNAAAGTLTGSRLVSSINSVALTSLGGAAGAGFTGASVGTPHSFEVMDSQGAVTTVFYTGQEDLFEIVSRLNNPLGPGAHVFAKVDPAGTGIEIRDLSSGPGTMTVTDLVGTVAQSLGIDGTHADGLAQGGNLNFKYLNGNRLLSEFGLDDGFISGSIEVVDKAGSIRQVNINNVRTLGELISQLNAIPTVSVSINATGDGIRFNDTTGGTQPLIIRDVSGTIARKLGLRGTFDGTAIVDRRFEYTVDVGINDTLNDIASRIKGLGIPVLASILDDGSKGQGFRLSVTGTRPGARNNISVRSDIASLNFGQTSRASDAILLYGNSDGTADPVVVRSQTNTFKRVLDGVTIDALGVSDQPVTVSVTRDLQAASNDITDLFETYNALRSRMDELSKWDSETNTGGPLLGNGTVQRLRFAAVAAILDPVDGLPLGSNTIEAAGVKIKTDGTFEVDPTKLLEALQTRLDEVKDVFGNIAKLDPNTDFKNWNNGDGVDSSTGGAFTITFADGSADLTVDVSGFDRLKSLLDALNADPRLDAGISPDGTKIFLRDVTTPNGTSTFSLANIGDAKILAALGFTRTTPLPGTNTLETKAITLDTELGVARRVNNALTSYTSSDGLINEATTGLDDRVKAYNAQIEKIQERIDAEQKRLEKQFAAMESALSESKSTSTALSQQLAGLNSQNNN
jgi:flagellar capping protein FliD